MRKRNGTFSRQTAMKNSGYTDISAMRELLRLQCDDRVDPGGTPGRQQAGDRGHDDEKDAHGHEGQRVGLPDSVELLLEEAIFSTFDPCAPRARRTPISRLRWLT